MISNPDYGWCDFDLGDFHGKPSCKTDVVGDLIKFFIKGIQTGRSVAFFDEEVSEFTLVITPYSLYLIEEDEEGIAQLHNFSNMNVTELIRELINDIENNIDKWSRFNTINKSEVEKEKDRIIKLLSELK